jgi:hypothetical protein
MATDDPDLHTDVEELRGQCALLVGVIAALLAEQPAMRERLRALFAAEDWERTLLFSTATDAQSRGAMLILQKLFPPSASPGSQGTPVGP